MEANIILYCVSKSKSSWEYFLKRLLNVKVKWSLEDDDNDNGNDYYCYGHGHGHGIDVDEKCFKKLPTNTLSRGRRIVYAREWTLTPRQLSFPDFNLTHPLWTWEYTTHTSISSIIFLFLFFQISKLQMQKHNKIWFVL